MRVGAGATARIKGKVGKGAGMIAEVEAGATARMRKARGAASETAKAAARREERTATSGPGQAPKKRSSSNPSWTRKR